MRVQVKGGGSRNVNLWMFFFKACCWDGGSVSRCYGVQGFEKYHLFL